MKNEKIILIFMMLILMGASFYAGFKISPDRTLLLEKNLKIKELEDTIVQQEISNSYMIKLMMSNKVKYKNAR